MNFVLKIIRMKNYTTNTKMIQGKNIVLLFVFLISLLLISTYANGQPLMKESPFIAKSKKAFTIKEFTVREINKTAYFRFLIIENRTDIKYTLEGSANGKDFKMIKEKEGYPSPNNQPLLYCYKLNTLNNLTQHYRIKIESKKGIEYSNIIKTQPYSNYDLTVSKNN